MGCFYLVANEKKSNPLILVSEKHKSQSRKDDESDNDDAYLSDQSENELESVNDSDSSENEEIGFNNAAFFSSKISRSRTIPIGPEQNADAESKKGADFKAELCVCSLKFHIKNIHEEE